MWSEWQHNKLLEPNENLKNAFAQLFLGDHLYWICHHDSHHCSSVWRCACPRPSFGMPNSKFDRKWRICEYLHNLPSTGLWIATFPNTFSQRYSWNTRKLLHECLFIGKRSLLGTPCPTSAQGLESLSPFRPQTLYDERELWAQLFKSHISASRYLSS